MNQLHTTFSTVADMVGWLLSYLFVMLLWNYEYRYCLCSCFSWQALYENLRERVGPFEVIYCNVLLVIFNC